MDTYALDDTMATRRTKRRRALLAILLGSSLLTLSAGASSLAYFTSSDTTDGAWSTGTIILGVTPNTTFGASDMMPGDKGQQTITVSNTGTGQLRYDMTKVLTDPDGLLAQMTLDINAGACSGSAPASTGSFAAASLTDVVLNAGASDNYCFVWGLPSGTGNGFQDVGGSAVFTFSAEQTANNP